MHFHSVEDFLASTMSNVDGLLNDGWGEFFPVKGPRDRGDGAVRRHHRIFNENARYESDGDLDLRAELFRLDHRRG